MRMAPIIPNISKTYSNILIVAILLRGEKYINNDSNFRRVITICINQLAKKNPELKVHDPWVASSSPRKSYSRTLSKQQISSSSSSYLWNIRPRKSGKYRISSRNGKPESRKPMCSLGFEHSAQFSGCEGRKWDLKKTAVAYVKTIKEWDR